MGYIGLGKNAISKIAFLKFKCLYYNTRFQEMHAFNTNIIINRVSDTDDQTRIQTCRTSRWTSLVPLQQGFVPINIKTH